MKKRVALIFGGEGHEHGISEISAQNLYGLIDRELYEILPIGISNVGEWFIYLGDIDKLSGGEWQRDGSLLKRTYPIYSGFQTEGCIIRVDAAILCLHGDKGEDGSIAGSLEAAHIKYVGEDVYASAVTQDKVYTKCIAEKLGIPTAKWILSSSETKEAQIARYIAKYVVLNLRQFIQGSRILIANIRFFSNDAQTRTRCIHQNRVKAVFPFLLIDFCI